MSTELARLPDTTAVAKNRPTEGIATLFIGGQMFGISISEIRDVLILDHIFNIPLAPPTIVGLINVRGRIVTVISLMTCLGLDAKSSGNGASRCCVTVEYQGSLYGLLVDRIGDIIQVSEETHRPVPHTLNSNWRSICPSIYLVEKNLLVQLNTLSLLDQLLATAEIT